MPSTTPALSFIVGDHSEWFWAMSQAFIILVSLVAIYRQIELQRSSNELQLLFELQQEWYAKRMTKYRKGVCEEYQADTGERITNAETEVANFFERLGTFYKKLTIPIDVIWHHYSYHIEHMWPLLEKPINWHRKQHGDLTFFSDFEALWKAMQDYSKKKGAPSKKKTTEEIDGYVKEELRDLIQDLLDSD